MYITNYVAYEFLIMYRLDIFFRYLRIGLQCHVKVRVRGLLW
jgi:hypothetical protein